MHSSVLSANFDLCFKAPYYSRSHPHKWVASTTLFIVADSTVSHVLLTHHQIPKHLQCPSCCVYPEAHCFFQICHVCEWRSMIRKSSWIFPSANVLFSIQEGVIHLRERHAKLDNCITVFFAAALPIPDCPPTTSLHCPNRAIWPSDFPSSFPASFSKAWF